MSKSKRSGPKRAPGKLSRSGGGLQVRKRLDLTALEPFEYRDGVPVAQIVHGDLGLPEDCSPGDGDPFFLPDEIFDFFRREPAAGSRALRREFGFTKTAAEMVTTFHEALAASIEERGNLPIRLSVEPETCPECGAEHNPLTGKHTHPQP